MKGARGWVIVAMLSVAIAAAAYLIQPAQGSPEHSSNSDAKDGTSAARLFAEAMGHPTDQVAGSFGTPAPNGVMFVFSPTSPFTADEAQRTQQWVRSGGVLIYAAEQGDPELDHALGVNRLGGYAFSSGEVGSPVVDGVNNVSGSDVVMPLDPTAQQVAILRTTGGLVVGYLQRIASGAVVVLADPLALCNGYLDQRDNGRLLADLLGLSAAGAPVVFDEYHHGIVVSDFAPQAWVTTPWGFGLLWLLIAIFAGLVLRGRSFGPLLQRPAEVARADSEWAEAVGNLLRRSSARGVTLGVLATATERAVAARTGIPVQPRERFWNALWVRAPELASELADVENALHGADATEAGLFKAAQRLHALAHPAASDKGPRAPSPPVVS